MHVCVRNVILVQYYRVLFIILIQTHTFFVCLPWSLCVCVGLCQQLTAAAPHNRVSMHSFSVFSAFVDTHLVDRLIECLRVYSQNKSHFNTEWTVNAEHSVSVILTCTCLTHCVLLIALVNIRRAKEKSYDKLIVRYTNTRTYTHTHMCLIACACISLVIYRYIVKSKMLNTHWLITNDTQTYFCKIAHRSHTPQQRKKQRLLCVFRLCVRNRVKEYKNKRAKKKKKTKSPNSCNRCTAAFH